jgi:predicted nucleotide-binding protein
MTENIKPIDRLGHGRFAFNCVHCDGAGSISRDRDNRAPYVTCVVCEGRGTVFVSLEGKEPFHTCEACGGKGWVSRDRDNRAPYNVCVRCSGLGIHPILGKFSLIEPSAELFSHKPKDSQKPDLPMSKKSCVFIVHGRNHTIRDQIDLFLSKDLGLRTAVMQAGAHGGRTLPEKFEEIASKCDFAVFLLTADDHLQDLKTNSTFKRARQNVILEVGYFWGALGRRQRVMFLVETDALMELPSDIQGIGWIPLTKDLGETKLRIQTELKAAGLI